MDTSIQSVIRTFDEAVWLHHLQRYVQDATVRGHSLKRLAGVQVWGWLYAIAGRVMITFANEACEVTVITAEDGEQPRMGLQAINRGIERDAIVLLQYLVDHRDDIQFVPDEKVKLDVMFDRDS